MCGHPVRPGPARHWSAAVVVLAAIAVAAILIAALAVGAATDQPPVGDVTVPNIVGMSLDRADAVVDDQGLVAG